MWFTGELDEDDIEVKTNDRTVYVEKSKLVFFDEEMKIDFSGSTNSFQLKSPQQIINGRMNFVMKVKAD
ncbi:hypothetical protein AM1BK_49720 [Neobacillus kokaensis]|uniref:Core domain-containing protein n=1 Tax=Neobacillus kokaensis TaxID=2759023 RepID=A0ABQ3NBX9_9BACI|nr:hypothetical protein AM1BK_49720 [Neobacillus kokaensis]